MMLLLAGVAVAQDGATPAVACVELEVDGQRIEDYACLSRLLTPTAAPTGRPALQLDADAVARRPPTALGLAHREATRQRMGNTFGKSTLPQRPNLPPPSLLPALRKP